MIAILALVAAAAPKQLVLFLCPQGGAKSVIAASYFNRLAEQRGLPYTAVAAAAESPYDAVPAPVAAYLLREGYMVVSFKPHRATPSDFRGAAKVIAIGCDLACVDAYGAAIERWDDVPKVSEDLPGSAAAIRRHVEALIAQLR